MAQHNAIIMSYANVLQKTFMSCRPSIVHPSINNMEISHTRSRTTGRRQDAGSHRVIRHLYDRSATLLFTIYSYIYIYISQSSYIPHTQLATVISADVTLTNGRFISTSTGSSTPFCDRHHCPSLSP